jgi:hypothetical protein
LWQELQLIAWLADSRGSKNSIVPSKTFAGVVGLPGNCGGAVGIGLNCCCAFVIRSFCARAGETKTQMKHSNETARLLFMVTSLAHSKAHFVVHGNYDPPGS